MTSRGNGKRTRTDWTTRELNAESKRQAIKNLDLRGALEHYGLVFNHQGAALCPFHREKTASFRVKRSANGFFWHCFGCGESGDIIAFARKKFGLSYGDALDAICKDFGIVVSKPTIKDQERLDILRIQRYNSIRRYSELIDEVDVRTRNYWYAYDTLQHVTLIHGGKSLDNESYVSAQFALLRARNALEDAEYACAQYLYDNPQAIPTPPEHIFAVASKRVHLPSAPKWRETHGYDNPYSEPEKR